MKEFFQKYDLNEESVSTRYATQAAAHYRQTLKGAADSVPCNDPPPTYDEGREPAPISTQSRSFEEIKMQSPSIGSQNSGAPQ